MRRILELPDAPFPTPIARDVVLGPWLSLRTKLQSLVLSLALRVEALNCKSLVESFCQTG